MEQGFIPERGHESTIHPKWFPGEMKRNLLGTLKIPRPLEGIPLVSYRCSGCGLIEIYANHREE